MRGNSKTGSDPDRLCRMVVVSGIMKTPIEFERCIIRRYAGGQHSIRCKKGLWRVDCSDLETAEKEAMRYWIQYAEDGEYDYAINSF